MATCRPNNTHRTIQWADPRLMKPDEHRRRLEGRVAAASFDPSVDGKALEVGGLELLSSSSSTPSTMGRLQISLSTGSIGFRGTKRGGMYAGEQLAFQLARACVNLRILLKIHLVVKGTGRARRVMAKAMRKGGFKVLTVSDQTPCPHNGPRPKKARRV
ncbi:MAG: 30S ribosomal protein S11 [Thaumarchaeota archaeon]|nr:30S ribosomal protein S11 [Nitrososphaerota archaeon]